LVAGGIGEIIWAALGGGKMKLLVEAVIIVIVLFVAVRFFRKRG
jgi:hypothetical protein